MKAPDLKSEFLAAYDAHADAIYRFCVVKVSDSERARDITQEVFMRFWQEMRNGADVKHCRAFLYKIARNLVIDWYRKKKADSLDVMQERGFDPPSTEHKDVERGAQMREVYAVIDKLDDSDRDVLVLRYVEGLAPKEIAEIIGTSPNVVSVRIHRATKKVRELLNEYE